MYKKTAATIEASRLSDHQTGRNMLRSFPGLRVKLCTRQDQTNGQLAHYHQSGPGSHVQPRRLYD
jgi:hypothetical protein